MPSGAVFCATCGRSTVPAPPVPAAPIPPARKGGLTIAILALVLLLVVAAFAFLYYRRITARQTPASTPQTVETGALIPPPAAPAGNAQPLLSDAQPVQPVQIGQTPPAAAAVPQSSAPKAPADASNRAQGHLLPPEPAETTNPAPPQQTDIAPPPMPEESPAPAQPELLPPSPPAEVPKAPPSYQGPTAGTILWSGQLPKNGTIVIEGGNASAGSLRGNLPGVPVIVEVEPKDVGLAEAPSPGNGWNRLVLRSRNARQTVVTIRWTVLR